MVRVRAGKKPVLSQSLDLKVSNLVYKLLDEKTQENKKKNGDDNEDQFANIALARDLKISDALIYVQQKDLSLQRVKKVMLEKTLERIIRDIKEEEKIEMQNIIGEDDEPMNSDFEGIDVDDLMDVKDQNQMNKSVVNLWNIKQADVPSETPMDTATETEKDEQVEMIERVDGSIKEEKKSKKRSKDSSRPSKRQKGMLLLFQRQMNLH
jgi:ribosome biogenesis ATPase